MARRNTRRDFLTGKAAADALADAAGGPLTSTGAHAGGRGASYVIRLSRPAMACEFEIFLNAGQYPEGPEIALQALDLLEPLEEQMSLFRPESTISEINRDASDRPVEVESRLFDLLQIAARLHDETGGAFDITSAPLWEAWGFADRAPRVPNEAILREALARVGGNLICLDAEKQTVQLLRRGVRLNLGSIGKGFALDRCAEELAAAGVHDFLLHAGGSSIVARGDCLSNPPGWIVGVPHPLRPNQRLGELRLINRALATSGSRFQSFLHEGRRLSHVIDPRTGQPVENVYSATAIAFDATTTDALATAFFVLGTEGTQEYCNQHPDSSALLCVAARRSGGYELQQFGMDDVEFRLL